MIRETKYEVDVDKEIRLRVYFTRERSQVIAFVVQLEYFIDDKWYPVIRYDTAHQFAHCDILRPDGSQEKHPMPVSDFSEALTYAQKDIMVNFYRYCTRFRGWL